MLSRKILLHNNGFSHCIRQQRNRILWALCVTAVASMCSFLYFFFVRDYSWVHNILLEAEKTIRMWAKIDAAAARSKEAKLARRKGLGPSLQHFYNILHWHFLLPFIFLRILLYDLSSLSNNAVGWVSWIIVTLETARSKPTLDECI